jgi:formylglycine-generating enzyme required for sulfatase activity
MRSIPLTPSEERFILTASCADFSGVLTMPAGMTFRRLFFLLFFAGIAGASPAWAREPEENKAGIQWVSIPGGTFMMGADDLPPFARPRHEVTVKTFQMAKTPVTNRQYKACIAAGACTPVDLHHPPRFEGDDQPAFGMHGAQLKAFAAWAGGRLPTEAEWEYAARSGGKDQKYPWGDAEPTCTLAAVLGCGNNTVPVCSKPAGNTKQGLCDMAGNVWEWVEDFYHDSYDGAPTDGSAWLSTGFRRVVRGGSVLFDATHARASFRDNAGPGDRPGPIGFRLAR